MDNHDQAKNSLSGHGSHEVHICHKCGWPFPNAHPSSRHRRAHKKICGTIEGYKLIDSEGHTHLDVSDDEHHQHSDEDSRTPSPKSEKKSISGGIMDRSHTFSGDDVFSDAATEFSDGPVMEEKLKGVTESDKNLEKNLEAGLDAGQSLKVDATADTIKPLDDPSKSSQVPNPSVVETATTEPLKETKAEEHGIPISGFDGSPIKSEILMDSPKEEEDIKGNEEDDIVDKISTNEAKPPSEKTVNKASEAELLLQEDIDVKASDLMKADINSVSVQEQSERSELEILKPEVESVEQLKADSVELCDTKVEEEKESLHVLSVATVIDQPEILIEDFKDHKAVKSNLMMSLDDLPRESESVENVGASLDTTLQSDSATGVQTDADSVKICDAKGEEKEDLHVLSSADLHVVDQPEITIEKFKDHKAVQVESEDSFSVSKVDEISNLTGGYIGVEPENDGIESERTEGREGETGKEKCATDTEETKLDDSPSQLSELPSVDGVPDSTKVKFDTSDLGSTAQTNSTSLKCPVDDDDDSREVIKETKSGIGAAVATGSESNNTTTDIEVLPVLKEKPTALPVDSGSTDDVTVVEVSERSSDKPVFEEPGAFMEESGISATKTTYGTTVDKQHEGCDDKLLKQPTGGSSAVDLSVDSLSQTDSLEGNWGSVSVISIQSDAPANNTDAEALPSNGSQAPTTKSEEDNFQNPKAGPDGSHSDKQEDAFEAPSFMTLVESEGSRVESKSGDSEIEMPKADALKSGWFPSLTNVVNESPGRKKNEEIIAKVTNWSAGMGKQHNNLKNFLSEANAETKPKPPSPKQEENGTNNNNDNDNVSSLDTKKMTSVECSEASEADQVVKKEMVNKEWNSPAKYPTDSIKKEKRKAKGKPMWVPFMCCSSVN